MNKEKIITSVWGVFIGGLLTMAIGFNWGGWVLGSTSSNLRAEIARNAVSERLTPMCVALFKQDADRTEKLKILKATESWGRTQFVIDQGWATMPFEQEPDASVAESCSELIMETI